MAIKNLRSLQMLMGANGAMSTPHGGLNDAIWGERNIAQARHNEIVDRIANMGKPGAGFLNTSKYGNPNPMWDGYNGLMMGLRDGAAAQGRTMRTYPSSGMPQSILGPSGDTRFDGDQIGLNTGQSLTDDTYGDQESFKVPIYKLRQAFGLK